jgi:hypothetical protein
MGCGKPEKLKVESQKSKNFNMNGPRKRILIGIGLVIAYVSFCAYAAPIVIPFDKLKYLPNAIEREWISQELPKAQERWDAQQISNYDINVQIDVSGVCVSNLTLGIRNNTMHLATNKYEAFSTPDYFNCSRYSRYEISQAFDEVNLFLNSKIWPEGSMHVNFDSQFGYVTYLEYNDNFSHYTITYSNFRVIK